MSNPNGLLSQKLYRYLNQGRTLNDILMRLAHCISGVASQKFFGEKCMIFGE